MMSLATTQLGLLAQADCLLLLGRWLGSPPTDPHDDNDDLRQLARHCSFGPGPASLVSVSTSRASTPIEDWVAEHNRLFEGGVTCPPNETAYVRRDKGAILSDIAGFYHAFGFEPAQGVGEKPDHIITELQFAALLLVMAGRAAAEGRADDETTTREALASFSADHLGAWIDLFCQRLAQVSRLPCFTELADVIITTWCGVCRDQGLAPAENELPTEDSAAEGTPYECDHCPSA